MDTVGDHAAWHFEVPVDLGRKLRTLAEHEGEKTCLVYLTAYAILLSRYGSADNLLICSPSMRRNTPEIENLVGNFANPVVIAVGCAPNLTFLELLGQVSATTLEAQAHLRFRRPKTWV